MRKKITIGLSILALTLGVLTIGYSNSGRDMPNFNNKYPSSTLVGNCSVCHTSPPTLNPYGAAYKSAGRNTAALTSIQGQDSDGDGASNLVEINAGTNPGNSSSTPPPPPPPVDTTPPSATISNPSTNPTYSTGTTPLGIGGSASDNVAVTQVTWSNDRGGSGTCTGTNSWSVGSITLLSGQNVITVTARDAAGNTATDTITITYTPPPPPPTADTTPPTVTSFNIPSTSNLLDVPINQFAATDNVAVTGCMVTTSATPPATSAPGWAPAPPVSFSFSAPGAYTLYAWAKDAANNVSNHLSRTVTITAPDSTATPDMTIWVGKWFKVTERNTGYSVGSSGIIRNSGSFVGYLKFWNWDPNNGVLQGDRYEQDPDTGQWSSESLTLLYIAGTDLDFLCSFQVTDNATNTMSGFTARLQGRGISGVLKSGTFKTLGGYYVEKSNGSGPTVHYAGGLRITGYLVPDSRIPVPSEVLLH